MKRATILFTCMFVLGTALAGEAASVKFTKKPTAKRAGGKVKIEFAVSRSTDVAVYIENGQGKIVRHLVAGVLGKNPPKPLKPGALAQSIEWDGKDDIGKPATGGPFKVRVGLGLKANWGGLAFADKDKTGPNRIEGVTGLAAGPDGRVYVLTGCAAWLYWTSSKLHVFRRDGSYEKTIKPFPSNLPLERVKTVGAFVNSFGKLNPISHRILGMTFYPHEDVPQQPAVTTDGRIVLATATYRRPFLSMLDTEGGIPEATYSGPALKGMGWAYPRLVPTQEGKAVFLTGVGKFNPYRASKPWHAVYRAKLPDRGPLEVFFGEPGKPGGDNTHLNDPRGLALDGKGHVLVADLGNNRVVVFGEKDKSFAGSFPVPAPNWLAVHPKTGAVYVYTAKPITAKSRSGKDYVKGYEDSLVKFSSWKQPRELARLQLPPRKSRRKNFRWSFALDTSAEPAVLWVGRNRGGPPLLRCEDQGAKFSDLVPAKCAQAQLIWRPASDPTRQEVACKVGSVYTNTTHILNEKTGQTRKVARGLGGSVLYRLGPDGSMYGCRNAGGVFRLDRDGKPKPFPATLKDPKLRGRLPAGSTGTTAWDRDFYVDRRNDIYVRKSGPVYHGLMTVEVYDQKGNQKRTAIWTVSDGMYGPRVDPKGNLYIMEAVKPPGQPFPKEFSGKLTGGGVKRGYDWIYGSIIKFGPKGGAVWFAGKQATPVSYDGWRACQVAYENSFPKIKDLRTTGGGLTGTIVGKGAVVRIPVLSLDTTVKKFSFRLKNSSKGTKAALYYNQVGEGYGRKSKHKSIEVKPSSDFAEYTIDMSTEAEWKGHVYRLTFSPAQDAAKGEFVLDWFRIGEGDKAREWKFDAEDGPDKKLPATMKKETVYAQNRPGSTLQGALWYRSGFSPVGDMGGRGGGCHCTGSDFDVDDFGRTFAPDTGRFRVGVLDTNGNEILSFGGYGNQDFCGPESYVLDPAGKFLRPRQASDPKDLKSPFTEPEIGLAWIVGLAVTDRYAYVDDVINKRILRVKLGYAAEETCNVR